MKIFKSITITLAIVIGLFIAYVTISSILYFDNVVLPWDKPEAIEATLEWGGLANIPQKTKNISVEMKGSMFTRQFVITFEAKPEDIETWKKNSKRLINNTPEIIDNNIEKYKIIPGEKKAYGGYVTIDRNQNKVIIDMSWS